MAKPSAHIKAHACTRTHTQITHITGWLQAQKRHGSGKKWGKKEAVLATRTAPEEGKGGLSLLVWKAERWRGGDVKRHWVVSNQ